jgi:hypothetical protein
VRRYLLGRQERESQGLPGAGGRLVVFFFSFFFLSLFPPSCSKSKTTNVISFKINVKTLMVELDEHVEGVDWDILREVN